MMRRMTTMLLVLVAGAFAVGQAAETPYGHADDSWISISGTVQAVTNDAFTLDYGPGLVTVEMDDGDRDADGYKLIAGDRVVVNGKVDADLFERTTIEASSVYVEKLGTHFYASAADEEDLDPFFYGITAPVPEAATVLVGTVTEIDEEEFTLNTGATRLTVEVEELPYDPLDDEGYQKITTGDVVKVVGEIDLDFFEGREMEASSLVKLSSAGAAG